LSRSRAQCWGASISRSKMFGKQRTSGDRGIAASKVRRTSRIVTTDFAIVLTVVNGESSAFKCWKTASPYLRPRAADCILRPMRTGKHAARLEGHSILPCAT
jgi:hypothetical protein